MSNFRHFWRCKHMVDDIAANLEQLHRLPVQLNCSSGLLMTRMPCSTWKSISGQARTPFLRVVAERYTMVVTKYFFHRDEFISHWFHSVTPLKLYSQKERSKFQQFRLIDHFLGPYEEQHWSFLVEDGWNTAMDHIKSPQHSHAVDLTWMPWYCIFDRCFFPKDNHFLFYFIFPPLNHNRWENRIPL